MLLPALPLTKLLNWRQVAVMLPVLSSVALLDTDQFPWLLRNQEIATDMVSQVLETTRTSYKPPWEEITSSVVLMI